MHLDGFIGGRRLASKMPGLQIFLHMHRCLVLLQKQLAGVTQKRKIPKFAERTFREWFKKDKGQSQTKNNQPNQKLLFGLIHLIISFCPKHWLQVLKYWKLQDMKSSFQKNLVLRKAVV